jgi:hypothetical protein
MGQLIINRGRHQDLLEQFSAVPRSRQSAPDS